MNSLSIEHFTESFGSFPYSGADAPKGALPNFPPSLMGHVPRVKLPLWSRYLGHIGRLIRYAACPFCRSSPSCVGTSKDGLVSLNVFGVFLSSGENTMQTSRLMHFPGPLIERDWHVLPLLLEPNGCAELSLVGTRPRCIGIARYSIDHNAAASFSRFSRILY